VGLSGHSVSACGHGQLATLPLAAQYTATMLATIPASLFMQRFGRRWGFTLGQLAGVAAAGISAWALVRHSFWQLVLGGALIGVHNAFWQYYRFAASELASDSFKSRAISLVMAGGVVAAFAGPNLAKSTRLLLPSPFAGSYLVVVLLCLASACLLQFIHFRPAVRASGDGPPPRSLPELTRQPQLVVAIVAGVVGYAVMLLVMSATPLAMTAQGLPFASIAMVMQWHTLCMYLPSFFTGSLIRRFGVLRIILVGGLLNVGCILIALSGQSVPQFLIALVLLGTGWNFMFVGGTTLLASTYRPVERAKVQSLNEFLVFGTVALATLSSAFVQSTWGWRAVIYTMGAPVAVALAAILWLQRRQRSALRAAENAS
jgi:MFS family permease